MSCPTPETLAMWVDDGRRAGPVEAHVCQCSTCARFVDGLCEDQMLLRSGVEALPEDSFIEVRQRVLESVSRGTGWRRRLFAAAAVAAVACGIVAVNFNPQPKSRVEPKPVVATAIPAVPNPIAIEPAPIVRAKRVRRKPESFNGAKLIAAFDALFDRTEVSAHPGQTVITMQTADPSVTVLLLTDSNGDGE